MLPASTTATVERPFIRDNPGDRETAPELSDQSHW